MNFKFSIFLWDQSFKVKNFMKYICCFFLAKICRYFTPFVIFFFMMYKRFTCCNKDLACMTQEVKVLCLMKTKIYENYIKNGRYDADND